MGKIKAQSTRNVPTVRLGIDIGGTFTDLVARSSNGHFWRLKVPTTPEAPAIGALGSVRRFLKDSGTDPEQVGVVVHATTLASNALLTGQRPKVALVTTEGFRDVLEIGRQNRPELYNLQVDRLPPLVPRRYRFEVPERVSYDGRILQPVDLHRARKIARKIRGLGIRTVAICFLHSYANSRNERTAAAVIRRESPGIRLSVSSELLPEFREYERTSTTVVNAWLEPLVARYLAGLLEGLSRLGVQAPLFVMQSNGGVILSDQAAEEPARIIESGPVAGAVASKAYGRSAHAGEIISLDVGGTTSKAGVWRSERFEVTNEYEVGGRAHGVRRLEGSGYPVRFPYVDLVEVGTGGGSLARVDSAGVLHVGPESAGASPGPACYGKGGILPTLTDANLLLGRLNPEQLLGGELRVDVRPAEKAIREHVAVPLKTGVLDAAKGILRIAIANIAGALRAASVERGYDPRQMILVAFGGAGPMHACEVAEQLGIDDVLVPPWAGLFSSLGLLLASPMHDFAKTVLRPVDNVDCEALTRIFWRMEKRGRALLRIEGVEDEAMAFERFFDMRYRGQSFELTVPVPRRRVDNQLVRLSVKAFQKAHRDRYGYADVENPVELVNLREYCTTKRRTVAPVIPGSTTDHASESYRDVLVNDRLVKDCRVLDRGGQGPGSRGRGPCVVEDYDSTIIVPSDASYSVDRRGSIRIVLN